MADKQADKAMTRLDRIIDKIAERLPTSFPENVNVDVAKLIEMGAAGYGTYLVAEPLMKQALTFYAWISDLTGKEFKIDPLQYFVQNSGPYHLWRLLTGETITEAEQKIIDDYKMPEEHKLAMALFGAVLIPKTPEILKGVGEIIPDSVF